MQTIRRRNEHRFTLQLQLAFVVFTAFMHIFLIVSLLNGSFNSTKSVVRITYTREAVLTAAHRSSNLLLQAIDDLKSLREGGFIVDSDKRAKSLQHFFEIEKRRNTSAIDPFVLCKAAALKEAASKRQIDQPPELIAPFAEASSSSVVFISYFGDRVDPTRCWQFHGGHLPKNSLSLLRPWYDSIERLGLHAIVFHDNVLSDQFAEDIETDNIKLQKVKLGRVFSSIHDERWEVYARWLQSPAAADVKHIIHIDPSETIISRDPFFLMENQPKYDLWVDMVPSVQRDVARTLRCYPSSAISNNAPQNDSVLLLGELLTNPGVMGGTKDSFLKLANAVTDEIRSMNAAIPTDTSVEEWMNLPGWHCQGPALHALLARKRIGHGKLAGMSVFSKGFPFCGDSKDCTDKGICDYAIYRE